jgi:hypothetical protein
MSCHAPREQRLPADINYFALAFGIEMRRRVDDYTEGTACAAYDRTD